MKPTDPNRGFVDALRAELEKKVGTRRPSVTMNAIHEASRWRVPLVTVVTGLAVVAVATVAIMSSAGVRSGPATAPTQLAKDGTRVLIATAVPDSRSDVGYTARIGVNPAGCITFGSAVLVASPGSNVGSDGTIHLQGFGDYRVGDTPMLGGAQFGADSTLLPDNAVDCPSETYLFAYSLG